MVNEVDTLVNSCIYDVCIPTWMMWAVCTGLMLKRATNLTWRQKAEAHRGRKCNEKGMNKSDLLRPHTVSCSLHAFHPNPSQTLLKTWNLCWQLNLLTFVTQSPLPPEVGHHWKEEVTRPRRGKVDSDDAFEMRGNKMDGGGCSGSSMFLLVKESRVAFFTVYNEFVLLLLFSLSLRLGKLTKMGAVIVSNLCWSFDCFVLGLATGLTIWCLNSDYLSQIILSPACPRLSWFW